MNSDPRLIVIIGTLKAQNEAIEHLNESVKTLIEIVRVMRKDLYSKHE